MFRSLRAKLVLSHLLIIAICLALAGTLWHLWWQRGVRTVPTGGLRSSWREQLPPLVGIGLLASLVAMAVSYFVSRSITGPVEAMTRAAEEMAAGYFGQQIKVEGQDEIARLAAAFNRMAQEVERSHRMERDFLINVSHDLQTPLTSIQGFSQAISEGAIQDPLAYQAAGRIIHEESDRMGRLVKALLDLARLEGGQAEMTRTPVDMGQLLHHCVERFASRAKEVGIALSLAVHDALPRVMGDSDRLSQVFSNLLDNALKFTPTGGQVSVEAYALLGWPKPNAKGRTVPLLPFALEAGDWVIVTVSDTGIGIAEDDLERIFEHFYRADKSRGTQEGLGLGLSIAREIVALHGGQIAASSVAEQGSRFYVALPAAKALS